MTSIISLLLINVQWLTITYQIQHKPLSLEISESGPAILLLPLSAVHSSLVGLLANVQAHCAFFHCSPFATDRPLGSAPTPKAFLLSPTHIHLFTCPFTQPRSSGKPLPSTHQTLGAASGKRALISPAGNSLVPLPGLSVHNTTRRRFLMGCKASPGSAIWTVYTSVPLSVNYQCLPHAVVGLWGLNVMMKTPCSA